MFSFKAVLPVMAAGFIVARNRGLNELASQIGFFVVINLVFTFSISNISIGGHIGGLIAGGLAAMAIAVGERRGRYGRLLERGGLGALGILAVVGCMVAAAESVPAGFG